jgi:site-specific DNA recombinase
VSGKDKRGTYLRCSRILETGLCDNRRTVSLQFIEDKVMQGIEEHLASRDLLAEYVREYHRAYTELRDSTARRRADLIKRLAKLKTDIKRAVPAVMENPRSKALQAQLGKLEDQRDKIEAALGNLEPPPTIELHPNVDDVYRRKVRDLKAALDLADDDN